MLSQPLDKPDVLDNALQLREHGYSLIPLHYRDKKPAVAWEAYQTAPASTDQLRQWFANGTRNLGVVTGAVSGVVVLDVDKPEEIDRLDLPRTPTVKTSKGYHFYFKHPGGHVGNCEVPGIGDLRADGGQVVVPPSVHPSGAVYQWEIGLDQPLAELPDWLLQISKGKPGGAANDNTVTTEYGKAWFKDCEKLAQHPEPGRNNLLNTVACKAGSLIASGQLNEGEARKAMLDACKKNGLMQDGAAQVYATIHSGLNEGKSNPRSPTAKETLGSSTGKLTLRRASDIKMERLSWLWEGVLGRLKFTAYFTPLGPVWTP